MYGLTSPLTLIPVAASVPLFYANMRIYGAMLIASTFSSSIKSDMELIGRNRFNSDEYAVISSSNVSFYKGQTVIRGNYNGCASYGIMFVDKDIWVGPEEIRHEYGHFMQLQIFGLIGFTIAFAIPSLISASFFPKGHSDRYFETSATWLGDLY